MTVVFLRHGEAEEGSGDDESRKLTRKGRKETEAMAAALDLLHVRPDVLLTSPLVRAVQTAEIAAREFEDAAEPLVIRSLAPGHSWNEVRREIVKACAGRVGGRDCVLLCGHQPDLGKYIAEAIAQRNGSGLEMRKSAAVCVAWEESGLSSAGRICLALEPESAKRILKAAGE